MRQEAKNLLQKSIKKTNRQKPPAFEQKAQKIPLKQIGPKIMERRNW